MSQTSNFGTLEPRRSLRLKSRSSIRLNESSFSIKELDHEADFQSPDEHEKQSPINKLGRAHTFMAMRSPSNDVLLLEDERDLINGINFDSMTQEELFCLEQVITRDRHLQRQEQDRIKRLHNKLDRSLLHFKSQRGKELPFTKLLSEWMQQNVCDFCQSSYNGLLNQGLSCQRCQKNFCRSCLVNYKNLVICKSCFADLDLIVKSGKWQIQTVKSQEIDPVNQQRFIKREVSTLLRQSIRKRRDSVVTQDEDVDGGDESDIADHEAWLGDDDSNTNSGTLKKMDTTNQANLNDKKQHIENDLNKEIQNRFEPATNNKRETDLNHIKINPIPQSTKDNQVKSDYVNQKTNSDYNDISKPNFTENEDQRNDEINSKNISNLKSQIKEEYQFSSVDNRESLRSSLSNHQDESNILQKNAEHENRDNQIREGDSSVKLRASIDTRSRRKPPADQNGSKIEEINQVKIPTETVPESNNENIETNQSRNNRSEDEDKFQRNLPARNSRKSRRSFNSSDVSDLTFGKAHERLASGKDEDDFPQIIGNEENLYVPPSMDVGELSQDEYSKTSGSIGGGNIEFKMNFHHPDCLNVEILRVSQVAYITNQKTPIDCYVKLYLLPDTHKVGKLKTKTVKSNSELTDFQQTLGCRVPRDSLADKTLNLSVWHKKVPAKNAYLGEINYPLKSFKDPSTGPISLPLQKNTASSSSIDVRAVSFNDEIRLLLALKFEKDGSVLKVHVLETSNFHYYKQLPSFFVKLEMWKNKSSVQKVKTASIKNTAQPKWNETFDLSNCTQNDCLEVTICSNPSRLGRPIKVGGVLLADKLPPLDNSSLTFDSDERSVCLWTEAFSRPGEWISDFLSITKV